MTDASDDIKKKALDALEDIAHDDLLFQPSPMHQTLKAQFWSRYQSGPLEDKQDISLATVQGLVNDSRLKRYWSIPGFKAWFTNQDETRERLEYLWQVGLDTSEQILRDPDPKTSNAKVQILKLLAEVTGRLVKNQPVEKFSDEAVNKMSEEQLKAFLTKKGVSIPKRNTKALEAEKEEVFS